MSIGSLYCKVSFIVCRRPRRSSPALLSPRPLLRALLFAAALQPVAATAQDTVRTLDEVEVSTQRAPSTHRTAAPTQVMDVEKIEAQGAMQLSDAVRRMAGVTLKDYGGVGGMKTVSARGLGTQFSTLTIDGVAVDNSQNGQVDLGRYLLGNAAYVSFSQGQQQDDLLSARAYAAGNVLSLVSAEPTFFLAERTNLKVGMEAGSFGMLSPQVLWEQKWSRRLKSSLWVNYLKSDGDYPFTLYYTADRQGKTSRERRRHSAMRMLTADASLFYTIAKDNTLTAKLHYMRGMHQLPGPVQLYNQVPAAESTREEVAFAQVRWRVEKERWKWQVLAKAQETWDMYEDSAASNSSHYMHNEYLQREAYASGSALWRATEWLDVNAAADGAVNWLNSNLQQRYAVQRSSLVATTRVRLHKGPVEAQGQLLATVIGDRVDDLDTMPTYSRFSPYASLMYTIGQGTTLRYFYKETFRAPNFSELYFFTIPRDLRPERARQHNLGITHTAEHWGGTLDMYYNRVTDKILAIPTQNMFLWSMQNIGKADIIGIDATANGQAGNVSMQLNYSYQHAVDRSNPQGKTYGHQLAYTPRHSGGASLRWENRWVNLGATATVVGERYYRMQNSDDTRLPAYCDLGLSADHKFDLRWGTLQVQVQVLNLLGTQYEIVRSYPMMGRNYRLKITYEI